MAESSPKIPTTIVTEPHLSASRRCHCRASIAAAPAELLAVAARTGPHPKLPLMRPTHRRLPALCLLLAASSALLACDNGGEAPAGDAWTWELPAHFPRPNVPADNTMSEAKFQLGRHLFYDTRLSGDGEFACASCHFQENAFADDRDRPAGATGQLHPRSSMSLANAAYAATLTWANPLLTRLEDQALIPMFGDDPIEMGSPDEATLRTRLQSAADVDYPSLFDTAFPSQAGEAITLQNITRALATFQRGMVSASAPIDRYFEGDSEAISDSAKRGLNLFNSERFECFHCHGGPTFSSSLNHEGSLEAERAFHNNGLFNIDGEGAYPPGAQGVFEITQKPLDMGRFRAPSLRNIAVTAPYMHDGSLLDLDEVIDHYARGGRLIEDGPYAGDGAESPFRSQFIPGYRISEEERADLHAFFDALTDETFLTNPRFASPFEEDTTP